MIRHPVDENCNNVGTITARITISCTHKLTINRFFRQFTGIYWNENFNSTGRCCQGRRVLRFWCCRHIYRLSSSLYCGNGKITPKFTLRRCAKMISISEKFPDWPETSIPESNERWFRSRGINRNVPRDDVAARDYWNEFS